MSYNRIKNSNGETTVEEETELINLGDFDELLQVQKDKYRGRLYWVKDTSYLFKPRLDSEWILLNETHLKEGLELDGLFLGLQGSQFLVTSSPQIIESPHRRNVATSNLRTGNHRELNCPEPG